MKLTRAKFESLIDDLVEKTIIKIDEVLKESGLSKGEIKEIIMVGGSTRVPLVHSTRVKAYFGKELNKSVNPDEL